MWKWMKTHFYTWFYMLFILVTAVAVYAVLQRQQRIDRETLAVQQVQVKSQILEAQISGCQRGNILRREVNASEEAIKDFMARAIESAYRRARLETGKRRSLDLENVTVYTKRMNALHGVTVIKNCREVVTQETEGK